MRDTSNYERIKLNDIVKIITGKYAGKLADVISVNTYKIKDDDGKYKTFTRDVCLRIEGIHYPNSFSKVRYLADNLEIFMTREQRAKVGFYLEYKRNAFRKVRE